MADAPASAMEAARNLDLGTVERTYVIAPGATPINLIVGVLATLAGVYCLTRAVASPGFLTIGLTVVLLLVGVPSLIGGVQMLRSGGQVATTFARGIAVGPSKAGASHAALYSDLQVSAETREEKRDTSSNTFLHVKIWHGEQELVNRKVAVQENEASELADLVRRIQAGQQG